MNILHSKIYGQEKPGTPLLVFHGLFGMLDNWASFGKEFGELFPTHLIDLRNHGKSFQSDEMNYSVLVEDIHNYMNFHGLQKINLLGHSLGGKVVMSFAITYPEKVEKLIVADISPKAYPPHHQGIFMALKSVDFDKITTRQEAENILSQYISSKSVIQFLSKNLYWTDDKKLNWRFNLKSLDKHYYEFVTNAIQFGKFIGETLFIGGEKSDYILPEDEILIKEQFPNSTIISISNAGHWVQAENPKDFNEAVKRFLVGNF